MNDTRISDDDLIKRGAGGDQDAFRILVERWDRPIFAFLERMLGSREEAQDLAQEAFLRMCQQAHRYRSQGQFRSWLYRIAGNLARSRFRRRKIVHWIRFDLVSHDRSSNEEAPGRQLERGNIRDTVRSALARLPDRQRQAVVLRQYENLDYREIAEAMGTTVSAVETLLHRAMTTLRKDLARKRSENETLH